MQQFSFAKTQIPGLYEIDSFCATDIRGAFVKDYSRDIFESNGISYSLEEVFYTISHPGVIRALHFQREKQQAKLVRCIYGRIFDVVVDLRVASPTYKKWLSFDLSSDNHKELLIPGGCAHGYLVLETSVVSYKCSEKFYPQYDDGIVWNDSDLAVSWPLDQIGGIDRLIIAEKDKKLQTFKQFTKKYGSLV